MTLVTGLLTLVGVFVVATLLSACSDTVAFLGGTASTASATAQPIVPPPAAPLPPPPKPAPPVRQTAKASAPANLAGNGVEQTIEPNSARVGATNKPGAAEQPAEPSTAEPAVPPGQTLALAARPPIRLIGLNRTATAAVLGAPKEERQVATARVWDYRGPQCRLAIYFYLDTGRNDFYALHYQIDGAAPGPDADQQCLQRIRDDARSQ